MKILITGFDPFGKETINPALEALKQLPAMILDAEIIKLEIPTVFHTSLEMIEDAIITYDPDVILSIGQAGGRSEITVERIGINCDDACIPDNEGNQMIDEPIDRNGPAAYFVNVPIKAMVENMKQAGIPASISNSAGTFVCNHVTYGVRHIIETKYPDKRSGFIHIPYLPAQVIEKKGQPSMALDTIVEGLIKAVEAIVETKEDRNITGGAIC